MTGAGWDSASGRLGPGAAWYAEQLQWKVFPVYGIVNGKCACGQSHAQPKDQGKHPHGSLVHNGQKDATSRVERVQEWWAEDPEANVGVVCRDSGFIVIDVDPRSGGLESWERLEALTEGALPDTVAAYTGEYGGNGHVQRGRHLFYRVEDGERLRGGIDGLKGIDVKYNGYVLVNPSRHASGVLYEWQPGCAPWEREIAQAPDELMELIRKAPPAGSGGGEYGVLEYNGEKLDVDAMIAEGIYEGERATKLFKIACAIANKFPVKEEMGKAAVRSFVRGINEKACHPPMEWGTGGDDDFAHQCENAINFVLESPKERLFAERLSPDLLEWARRTREDGVDETTPAEVASAGIGEAAGGGGAGNRSLPADPDAIAEEDGGVPGERSLTDLGNGRRIIDYAGQGVRFSRGLGWFVWNGQYWVPDADGGMVHEIAKRLPIWIASEVARYDEDDPRAEEVAKWGHRARSVAARRNAIADAASDARIRVPADMWDAHPHFLGVRNGVINLRTGELLAPDARLHITKQSRVAYTPGMRNVRWEQFLDFVTGGDKELQAYLQLAAGYTLTGSREHDCLFLVYGPAGSGKSTWLEVLGTILGDYYIPMDSDVLVESPGVKSSTEYHMAQLMGKRMIGISEWPEGRKTKEETIKRLTGDMTISARHPGERPFMFESQAKLWIGTNVKPQISERAMWRRIRAINFSHVPERPDPGLKPYLLDPEGGLPGALAWAVEGAVKLLGSSVREPLAKNQSRHVLDETEGYMKSEDRFGMFLEEETLRVEGGQVLVKDVYVAYRRWLEERGEREPRMITVYRMLQEKNERVEGSGNRAVVWGLTIAPKAVPAPEVTPWDTLVDQSRLR